AVSGTEQLAGLPPTEREPERTRRLARANQGGRLHAPALRAHDQYVPALDAELARGIRCNGQRVAPRELRGRGRQLEQPRIVDEPAVVHGRIGAQCELELGGGLRGIERELLDEAPSRFGRRDARERAVFNRAATERRRPKGLEIMRALRAPVRAQELVARL